MSYRTILMPILGDETDAYLVRPVLDLAKAFGSHVSALYVKPDPADVIAQINRELPARVIQDLIDAARDAVDIDLANARAVLEAAAKSAALPVEQTPAAVSGVSLQVREGELSDVVTDEALLCDLAVFEHPAQSFCTDMRSALEAVLLVSRRPLLLVPHHVHAIVGMKAAIGWDGSVAAAHAVSAAIPLLKRASSIEILTVTSGGLDIEQMDRLRNFLRLHGLNATEHAINPGAQQTGSALLDAAQRADAGLLVAGGYGHSRFREFALGGVTRHIFANVSIPVLMAH
jgi:nucleotide-binding universal stress UspA family protein